jgi:hypothetical protein
MWIFRHFFLNVFPMLADKPVEGEKYWGESTLIPPHYSRTNGARNVTMMRSCEGEAASSRL